MAVIRCASCGKRYSSVQGECPHCGANADDGAAKRRRAPGVGPGVHLLIAMLAAIAGAGWYYSAMATGSDTTYARWMIGVGLLWYVAARVWAALRRGR